MRKRKHQISVADLYRFDPIVMLASSAGVATAGVHHSKALVLNITFGSEGKCTTGYTVSFDGTDTKFFTDLQEAIDCYNSIDETDPNAKMEDHL